jgi:asparagine synthase (glutamine-hydrolysing)
MLRQIAKKFLPRAVSESPKRPLQTPQREWLRGELRDWADERIEIGLRGQFGNWLDREAVRSAWEKYCAGGSDNSFYVWQWISLSYLEGN